MAINKITAEQLFKIKRKSAQALPNKPSAQGYTAEEIKNYLTNFVTDDEDSFKAELDRIVDEINVFIGGIENVTLKNYVIDEIVKKFTEQNPVLNLSFNKETNLLEYETYSDNGSVDILPNGMVFVDGSLLKNKSGNSFYPQTSIDKLIDTIDDKTVREYLLSLQTKLTELQDEHDRDIASLTQSFESILGGDAPEALNTIKELAEALNNNPTQVDDILLQLTNLNINKVDKIIGKGLSTNDFTNDLKASLEALLQRDLANVSDIPTELKEFVDDSEHRLVTDAEKNIWNSKANAIHEHNISDILNLQKILDSKSDNIHSHTLEEIGAEAKGTASNLISAHNSNTEAHSDIRELIREVRNKVDGINEAISFVNEKQLSDWISGTYIRVDGKTTNDLFVGQHIYIQEQSERDFWVSSKPVSSINDLTPLPTDKINLEDYVLKDNLANVAASGSYNDLLHTPNIYYKLSEMIEDDEHKTITKQKLELIDTNAEKLLEKLDTNLGLTEANKMLVTDSNGNIVTAIAGSMSALIDSLDSSSTTMAPTANQVRILNNIKLDKQQGTENANKYLYVNSLGLIDLATIKTKLSEFINDNNYQTLTEVQALIKAIPTPDVSGQISSHNIDDTAHQDIRDAINNIDLSGYSKTDHTHDYSSLFADINHTHDYATQNDINTAISNLINGAPTTLDTLKEIADAMESNQSVVSALEQSIGSKANTSDLANYLPLTAGSGKAITGDLYVKDGTNTKNIYLGKTSRLRDNGGGGFILSTNGAMYLRCNGDGGYTTGLVLDGEGFKPQSNNGNSLGISTNRWKEIHGTTIYQNGKQVANAEDIPDTSEFAKTTDLSSYLPLTAGSTKPLTDVLYADLGVRIGSNNYLNFVSEAKFITPTKVIRFGSSTANNSDLLVMTQSYLRPNGNNTTLGNSSNQWKEIYGTTIYQGGKQVANKEDIPTVNNGTLTIQKNGTSVGTFTANQIGNSTINLSLVEGIRIGNPNMLPMVGYVDLGSAAGKDATDNLSVVEDTIPTSKAVADYVSSRYLTPSQIVAGANINISNTAIGGIVLEISANVPTNNNQLTNGANYVTNKLGTSNWSVSQDSSGNLVFTHS